MRSSGWSSRGTWACSALALGATVAALGAPSAGLAAETARLSIDPPSVAPGAAVDLVVLGPERGPTRWGSTTSRSASRRTSRWRTRRRSRWKQSRTGQAVTWWGGSIPENQFARFGVRGTAPPQAETVLFNVVIGDHTGKSTTYRVPLEVAAPVVHDGSRSLGEGGPGRGLRRGRARPRRRDRRVRALAQGPSLAPGVVTLDRRASLPPVRGRGPRLRVLPRR